VHHNFEKEHLLGFHKTRVSKKGYGMWSTMCLIIVGYVWKYRNDIIFKNKKFDIQEIFTLIQVKS